MKHVESADIAVELDVDRLLAILREHPVSIAILFGSHATGTTHSRSDIDIAVELDGRRPSDPDYNDVFLGLSADLSDSLNTDDVDVVDLHSVSPSLAESIFENGVLLLGDTEHATELRRQLTPGDPGEPSARERIDAALAKIDAHLDDSDTGIPASGQPEDKR